MADIKFPKGIFFKMPNEKAPSFVKGSISLKRTELIQWLESESDEWINLQAKVSKDGKPYLEIDTWKPTAKEQKPEPKKEDNQDNTQLPF